MNADYIKWKIERIQFMQCYDENKDATFPEIRYR